MYVCSCSEGKGPTYAHIVHHTFSVNLFFSGFTPEELHVWTISLLTLSKKISEPEVALLEHYKSNHHVYVNRKVSDYSFMVSSVHVCPAVCSSLYILCVFIPHNRLFSQLWRKMVSLLPNREDCDMWVVGVNSPLRMMWVIFF